MIPRHTFPLALFLALQGSVRDGNAEPRPDPEEPLALALPPTPTRSLWVTATYQTLLSDSLEPASRHGLGAALSYEFHVSPKFNVGLLLAYRNYPGDGTIQQLGYGVTLKHFFSDDWTRGSSWFPYLDYGLLQQQTFLAGRSGVAVSHDTRLGAGILFHVFDLRWTVNGALHISRLEYFDVDPLWVPYFEAQFGTVLPW